MHAVVVRANLPGGVSDARLENLRKNIIPRVSASKGFITGYWLEPIDDKAMSVVIFEDEASARAGAPPPGDDVGEGVTIESVEFRAVTGHA